MTKSTTTLYERLGGKILVSAMLTECLDGMWNDDRISHHFVGLNKDSFHHHFIDFFSTYILEGPESYFGPSLKQAHRGMQVTYDEYEIGISHLHTSLKNHAVSIQDIARIETFVRMIKPHIINQ